MFPIANLYFGQKRRKRKNIKKNVTFVTFVTLHSLTYLLINLFTLKIK